MANDRQDSLFRECNGRNAYLATRHNQTSYQPLGSHLLKGEVRNVRPVSSVFDSDTANVTVVV